MIAETIMLIFSLFFLFIALNAKKPKYKKDFFPPVSVIAWFWKDGHIVERKIKNFLSLKYPGKFEVIIVDNASQDETQEICEKYVKKGLIKYYRSKKEYDRKAYALDEAIKKVAKYDILAITDPDVICNKDWLINLVQPFKDKKVGAVIGLTHCGNFYKNLFTKLRAVEDEWMYVTSPLGINFGKPVHLICGANYAVRRQALEDVGYHGKKTLGEDFELTIGLHTKGWEVKVADANVWQEEVENFGQYVRQRVRWQSTGIESLKFYPKEFYKIFKKRPFGLFLFFTFMGIELFPIFCIISILYGVVFSFNTFLLGLISLLITNLAVIIGLIKFDKRHLIPYVPIFLLTEPFLLLYCHLILNTSKLLKRKVVWKSLYDTYYHAGTRIITK